MEKYKSLVIYSIVIALAYYILPFAVVDTGSAIFMLLGALPMITILVSFCYGLSKHHTWLFPIIVMLLFLAVVYLYLNSSALVYVLIYGVLSCIGYGVAQLFHHLKPIPKKEKE